ncbi:uncharacterized protein F4822DRAFT_404610 [Hypoxylon trugodes]|uniref:uncharacterized protein n=1 Tax=Hypoxylon trugodes TaxID=326681 RepID=UPI002190CD01|nr:uncharacterized protein F4822DRAFT_404610 [Hypoxylon trugodes]KAI1388986.1 hypothetical protein F4822DRAFT_404610 [Hypoxylon trugodes]
MYGRLILAGPILVAILALFLSPWETRSKSVTPPVTGRNNTVLFLVNCEYGLSNVHMAAANALLERHPEVHIHFGSFPSMAPRLKHIAEHASKKTSSTREIVFHELPGHLLFASFFARLNKTVTDIVHPPGLKGANENIRDMAYYVSPWTAEDHMTLYERFIEIIDEVDPSLIVLDVFVRPAIDATRKRNRLHSVITPNYLIDNFAIYQPYLSWLWKYPIGSSGIPYPIPWSRIPENIYLGIRYYYAMLLMPHHRATLKYLATKGLTDRVTWFNVYRPDVPWFTQNLLGASIPMMYTPPNVTSTGPMMISLSTVEEESPELAKWLARGPTVLVNLGSLYMWTEAQASSMAEAIAHTLSENPNLQVLWKFRKTPIDASGTVYSDEFKEPLLPFIKNGRMRMEAWLDVEPTALLESGHIVASVHHGGAGCYNEALGNGVPQIALPQWVDHYNFASLAEDIGVGVWGCQETSPYWTTECLREAFATIVDRNETSAAIREKARYFGEIVQRDPGQHIVAREIAKLAASRC